MPPLVVVAKAIPNNLKAEQLHEYSVKIIKGLVRRKIKVVSYSCDGTETERAVQRLLKEQATHCIQYKIKHPVPGLPDLVIIIAVIDGQVVIMIQDSKHALKTSRNNLFTGAKLLTLANHVAMYAYARDLAFGTDSPLWRKPTDRTIMLPHASHLQEPSLISRNIIQIVWDLSSISLSLANSWMLIKTEKFRIWSASRWLYGQDSFVRCGGHFSTQQGIPKVDTTYHASFLTSCKLWSMVLSPW